MSATADSHEHSCFAFRRVQELPGDGQRPELVLGTGERIELSDVQAESVIQMLVPMSRALSAEQERDNLRVAWGDAEKEAARPRHAEVLAKALNKFLADGRGTPSVADAAKLRQAVEPTLQALGYPKEAGS